MDVRFTYYVMYNSVPKTMNLTYLKVKRCENDRNASDKWEARELEPEIQIV